jgi:hypothetical protein
MHIRTAPLGLIVLSLVALLLAGCGRKAQIAEESQVVWQESLYEILWVEPEIILADSLVTIIRSNRIDSVLAEAPTKTPNRAAIELRIYGPFCNVSVGLLDASQRLIRPILIRNMVRGYYRLTVNLDRFRDPVLPPGEYFLKADYCGEVQMARLTIE